MKLQSPIKSALGFAVKNVQMIECQPIRTLGWRVPVENSRQVYPYFIAHNSTQCTRARLEFLIRDYFVRPLS